MRCATSRRRGRSDSLLLLIDRIAVEEELLLCPFSPMEIRIARCVIDTRYGADDAARMAETLAPKHLLVPSASRV